MMVPPVFDIAAGLDPTTLSIINSCHATSTPIIFSMTRHALGLTIRGTRSVSFSCVGIADASGAEDLYQRMLGLASQGRDEWVTQFSSSQGQLQPADSS